MPKGPFTVLIWRFSTTCRTVPTKWAFDQVDAPLLMHEQVLWMSHTLCLWCWHSGCFFAYAWASPVNESCPVFVVLMHRRWWSSRMSAKEWTQDVSSRRMAQATKWGLGLTWSEESLVVCWHLVNAAKEPLQVYPTRMAQATKWGFSSYLDRRKSCSLLTPCDRSADTQKVCSKEWSELSCSATRTICFWADSDSCRTRSTYIDTAKM